MLEHTARAPEPTRWEDLSSKESLSRKLIRLPTTKHDLTPMYVSLSMSSVQADKDQTLNRHAEPQSRKMDRIDDLFLPANELLEEPQMQLPPSAAQYLYDQWTRVAHSEDLGNEREELLICTDMMMLYLKVKTNATWDQITIIVDSYIYEIAPRPGTDQHEIRKNDLKVRYATSVASKYQYWFRLCDMKYGSTAWFKRHRPDIMSAHYLLIDRNRPRLFDHMGIGLTLRDEYRVD